ncbi:MAG: hypothetical protein AAFQ98_21620, partial [Bacteroidota bacterium]
MKFIANAVAVLLFLLGVLVFLLAEPWYALGLWLLSSLLLTPTAKVWSRWLPQRKGMNLAAFAVVSGALVVIMSSFGRKTYYEEEPREAATVNALSQHPVYSARLSNGLTYYYTEK